MDENSNLAEQMPQTIGRYQVQALIGYGAMGAVYRAFDPLIKRTLAIKTIRLDIPRQSPQYKNFIERFYHEARISGTLSHPNIVTLFDIGEENGVPFLAMEYVEGETIASLIEKGVRFAPEKVISLASQVASAVDYAHSKGVIHRDIKPSNLILYEGDRVKVTDFGIAKLVDAEMTQSGTLLGTPSYMSPEQAMGDKLDGRSDIFSLGVCAFEMLSGEQPFPGTNVTSILYKLVHVDPVEPHDLEMHGLVPQKWHDVFGKVLAKRPDDRYQTATEFVQDLEYCLGSWFGGMGEDTVSEGGGQAAVAAAAASAAAAAAVTPAPEAGQEETRALPALPAARPPAAPAPARVAAPTPPRAPAPPPAVPDGGDEPVTVVMKAASPEAGRAAALQAPPGATDGATIRMQAPAPSRPVSDATLKAPVSDSAPARPTAPPEATVKAPAPPPKPKAKAAPTPPKATPRPAPPAPIPPAPAPQTVTAPAPMPAPEPTTRAARPGLPAGLIVGGAAGLFVVALVVAGVLLVRQRRGAEPTPAPPASLAQPLETPSSAAPPPTTVAAAPGSLLIDSQPPGAGVSLNGEAKGATPLELGELALGSYELKLELKGYQPFAQTLQLTAEAPRQELKPTLAKAGPAPGVADVVSTPIGAQVTIDGQPAGETPLTDHRLRAGSHQVQVVKEGYEPFTASVKIEAGRRAKVDAQLRPLPAAAPSPQAEAVDVNRVYLNTAAEVDILAKKASGSSASYPESAPRLRSGDSVSVSVTFVVTETGDVADLKVLESANPAVDQAVTNAVRNWRYSPAVKRGVKVKVRITFKQTFRAG